jgi:hypothetical protein
MDQLQARIRSGSTMVGGYFVEPLKVSNDRVSYSGNPKMSPITAPVAVFDTPLKVAPAGRRVKSDPNQAAPPPQKQLRIGSGAVYGNNAARKEWY